MGKGLGRILVTGGAGFIGSHLTERLLSEGDEVIVFDNMNFGRADTSRWQGSSRFQLKRGDLLRPETLEAILPQCDLVFHLAANPEVRVGYSDTRIDFDQNIVATYNLLEAARRSGNCRIVFASTSAVYGEAKVIPTGEDYSPLKPISLYGASKLACESLISGYAHMFNLKSLILRLANVVGPRTNRGVILDFVRKLYRSRRFLEVLGDGRQRKSYLHIDDCVAGTLKAVAELENFREPVTVFNVGSDDAIDVTSIGRIVAEELGLSNVEFRFTNVIDGGRGWHGDVKEMLLDNSKLKTLGWSPRWTSTEAVRMTVRSCLEAPVPARIPA